MVAKQKNLLEKDLVLILMNCNLLRVKTAYLLSVVVVRVRWGMSRDDTINRPVSLGNIICCL